MKGRDTPHDALQRAETAVLRAAVGCVGKEGHAFWIATQGCTKTYYINEPAFKRLESAVAKLREARKRK